MRKIKLLLTLLIVGIITLPTMIFASSGNIKISSVNQAVVGNTVKVSVDISSSEAIGSWQIDLEYDKSALKLTSSTAEGGGTYMVNSSTGVKSKNYTFTFKTLKSGSTTVKVGSYYVVAYNDFSSMSMNAGSKTIRVITQEELEASYSSDAYLKDITVDGYPLNPIFNKATYEYTVEVENDVTNVTVTGFKNDSNAVINGGGNMNLEEGDNIVTLKVTAQKGNELTYTVNVYRKELNPIEITKDGVSYKIVRKANTLVNPGTFKETTIKINDTEIPALYSDYTKLTLVGVKNDDASVDLYIYNDGLIKKYLESSSNNENIIISDIKENDKFTNYIVTDKNINNQNIKCYALENSSKQVVVYGTSTATGKNDYYLYDLRTDTFTIYRNEIDTYYLQIIEYYKYIVLGLIGLVVILFIIIIFRKKGNKKNKKNLEELFEESTKTVEQEEIVENKIEEIVPEEIKEEVKEEESNVYLEKENDSKEEIKIKKKDKKIDKEVKKELKKLKKKI